MSEKIKVVFVCLGNICRSPAAEGAFRNLDEKKGLSDLFEIDSAGTADYHVGTVERAARVSNGRSGDDGGDGCRFCEGCSAGSVGLREIPSCGLSSGKDGREVLGVTAIGGVFGGAATSGNRIRLPKF